MKSEHRHELQTNELGKLADQVGGYFERYANQIMIAACTVSLAAAGYIYWSRSSQAREAGAWRDLAGARRAEDFAAVWETHPGTTAAQWAQLQEGESRLNEAIQLSFTNLDSARKEFEQARDVLQAAVDQKGAPAGLRERAQFALGRCLESMSDGNETDAVKAYHALVREFPDSIFRQDAERRIADLESGHGQEFYAWFSKYERPKAPESRPHDRTESSGVEESLELPEESPSTETKPEADPAEGAAEKPAGPSLKLGEEPAEREEAKTAEPDGTKADSATTSPPNP